MNSHLDNSNNANYYSIDTISNHSNKNSNSSNINSNINDSNDSINNHTLL